MDTEEGYGPQPASSNSAEQCVLGGMMLSGQAIADATAILGPESFYRPNHRTVYETIMGLVAAGEPVDPVTVGDALSKAGTLQRIGGAPYLHTLIEATPAASNVSYYARTVADLAFMRRMGEVGDRLKQLSYTPTTGADDIAAAISEGEKFFREINAPSDQASTFDELVHEWRKWQESDAAEVIATPWPALNEKLAGGLHKSRLYVVGGRPGSGKSVSALNMASEAAESGKSVLVFSLEMPKTEVASRLLSSGARANFGQIVRRSMEWDTLSSVDEYAHTNAAMNLSVIDKAQITVEQIAGHCRSVKGLDLAVVDYAQLVAPSDRRAPREQQVANVSRSLKVLAKDMGIAVVLAAQLNRQSVTGGKDGFIRHPTMADLRESGGLENDADVILLLHRGASDEGLVDVVVAKNRSGLCGVVTLAFKGSQARIMQARSA